MSPGKKPEMRLPPSRASVEDKLRDLERAGEWAQRPVVADIKNAGMEATEAPAETPDRVVEGEIVPIEPGTPLRALQKREKREKKEVTHLLKLPPETNERLENLLDHIPRSSKQRLILLAIDEFLTRVERVIEKSAGRKATG